MARRLAGNVALRNPSTGVVEVFSAGTIPPAWAAARITNPRAWTADTSTPAAQPPTPPSPQEPPRWGAGATNAAWRDYANTLGIDVPPDATRGDIITAVDERS